ncbi:hypothetical protein K461DRAFT_292283 [Myriangium duriaei CBS 260.36]|uniref:PRISE-like Rossmann-fold domain-containing protein n=1 Tax=Myriangium duriaei CBS 260.36 TaxID=1168546 RepID=A0A9P4J5X7_9PEZI|nr:hypothetical protein K461DRAFT_292283 [Myriangium duriaei CBS 260.36]
MAHALIFGASGVSGWAIATQALHYPSKDSFARVTALTNRPISPSEARLPDDPRLQLASGIDLTGSVSSIVSGLKSKVKDISSVSHVFFTAYIEKPSYEELREVNTSLFRNALTAIDQVAGSSLQAVILQTGGKHYGVEFPDQLTISPPLKEDAPRIPKPLYDNIFYYAQYDVAKELSQGKDWRFYEVRPDVIVGFTPGSNYMNVAQGLGFYFSLYREIHGEGAEVPFVGTEKSWRNTHTDTFQDVLAKQEIYTALKSREVQNGTSFNSANGDVVAWKDVWPGVAAWFGLKGTGPGREAVDTGKWAGENEEAWRRLEERHGLKKGIFEKYSWGFIKGVAELFDFDREYDLAASRRIGFEETVDTVKGYTIALDRMRDAKIIP